MISSRYKYDRALLPIRKDFRKTRVRLNETQIDALLKIDEKIKNNIYTFESVSCLICDSNENKTISEIDGYGLYNPIVICTKCGHLYANPRMNQISYNDFYDNHYRSLSVDGHRPNETYFAKRVELGKDIYNYLYKYFNMQKLQNKTILDVGCAAGGKLIPFIKKGWKGIGCELSSEYVEYGKEVHGLNLFCGSIHDLNSKNKFNIVLISHVLEHILNPKEFLLTINSLMTNDSLMLIEVPGLFQHKGDLLGYISKAHVSYFTLNTLVALCEMCGFKLIEADDTIRALFKKEKRVEVGNIGWMSPNYNEIWNYIIKLERRQFIKNLAKKIFYRFY